MAYVGKDVKICLEIFVRVWFLHDMAQVCFLLVSYCKYVCTLKQVVHLIIKGISSYCSLSVCERRYLHVHAHTCHSDTSRDCHRGLANFIMFPMYSRTGSFHRSPAAREPV